MIEKQLRNQCTVALVVIRQERFGEVFEGGIAQKLAKSGEMVLPYQKAVSVGERSIQA